MGDTPLYWLAIEHPNDAVQPHHWCVGRDAESFGDRCRRIANRDTFLSLAEQDAVLLRKGRNTMRGALLSPAASEIGPQGAKPPRT